MRRLIVILLSFFYVISVSGVTLVRHYCGGKLASTSLSFFDSEHACACGSKKMKKNCCKNQSVQLKVKCEHKTVGKLAVSKDDFKIIPFYTTQFSFSLRSATKYIYFPDYLPPPKPNNSLLVLNSVFRI